MEGHAIPAEPAETGVGIADCKDVDEGGGGREETGRGEGGRGERVRREKEGGKEMRRN